MMNTALPIFGVITAAFGTCLFIYVAESSIQLSRTDAWRERASQCC
jgi:hypothetical protein